VTAAAKYHPNDYRVHHLRAIAYADRFEGEPAFAAAQRAAELCDATPPPTGAPACGDAARSRLALLASHYRSDREWTAATLAAVVVSMRKIREPGKWGWGETGKGS